ncbi:MAG: UDP-glucose 4-epimerase GalE [Desulfovibrionaceae bacterium]|nr:UDP-glucose 4-epimerase GalE [Desulfovibrionaceae bacterium]
MKVLVTGGAGYIGSHTCKYLAERGHSVVTYDNLSTGHRELVKWGPFVHGDIRDYASLRRAIHTHEPDGLIHFASVIAVGESVQNPGLYYDINCMGSLTIMQVLRDEGVRPLVVSGSAAVYGLPNVCPVGESAVTNPINPYGRTKLVMEWMLADFEVAHKLPWVALRYFNASGADADGETGEWHEPETHLIPNVLRAVRGGQELKVFGNDYSTPDGTCIRDYIHVSDLAAAHVAALEHLLAGRPSTSINLGTGRGVSVAEIIAKASQVTGKPVPYTVYPRRPGDPAMLVADPARGREVLGWEAKYSDLETILSSAWAWECAGKTAH